MHLSTNQSGNASLLPGDKVTWENGERAENLSVSWRQHRSDVQYSVMPYGGCAHSLGAQIRLVEKSNCFLNGVRQQRNALHTGWWNMQKCGCLRGEFHDDRARQMIFWFGCRGDQELTPFSSKISKSHETCRSPLLGFSFLLYCLAAAKFTSTFAGYGMAMELFHVQK